MVDCGQYIPKLYLIGAFIGSIGCLSRADYNLPIMLFSYIVWNYMDKDKKIHIIFLITFSLIIDIFWFLLIYFRLWASEEYKKLADWEHGIHVTVTIMVLFNFIWKILCLILSVKFDTKLRDDLNENYRVVQEKIKKRG